MTGRHAVFAAFVVAQVFRPAFDAVAQVFRPAAAAPGLELRVGIARPGGGYTMTTMPLETYVARVLAGEAARDSEPAALEALAITIRTFALANRGRHRADGFDLCDQTHCQVVRPSTPATERAAVATAGRVLLRGGAPASVFYTASCGGRTEIPSAVWPGAEDPPFLPSRPDDACGGGPAWDAELTAANLARALRAAGFRGDRLRHLRILSRDLSGRVAKLQVEGLTPGEISGQDLRVLVGRTLGWQHIKSTAFELERVGDRYRFAGHGSGHGVGLCVIGSTHLAAAGQSAAKILQRYFPGLEIGIPGTAAATASREPAAGRPRTTPSAPPSATDVMLMLPDEDEGERASVAGLASRARVEVAQDLGVTAPSRVTLRFHPTTASYEQATGQPWFASGTVVAGELHLLPLAVLRDRGVLERTVRHELVHLMADPLLSARPAWVREGAAIYFAGQRPLPFESPQSPFRPQPRPSCPTEQELQRPVSAGALSDAFARALACFTRQVAAGKTWREVR